LGKVTTGRNTNRRILAQTKIGLLGINGQTV